MQEQRFNCYFQFWFIRYKSKEQAFPSIKNCKQSKNQKKHSRSLNITTVEYLPSNSMDSNKMIACVSLLVLVLVAEPGLSLPVSATTVPVASPTATAEVASATNHKTDLKLLLDITNIYVVRITCKMHSIQ